MDCYEARISLGVYVLGAIEPAERALIDSHLTTCRHCRDELAGVAGLPALLARVAPAEAIPLAATDGLAPYGTATGEPPRELLAAVLDLTAASRRRRRRREAALGIAAALIIASGAFGGIRLASSPAPASGTPWTGPAHGAWESASGQAGRLSAIVDYRSMGWGTQLAVKVDGIPVGTHCQLWVVSATGQRTLAGSWQTDDDEGAVWYPASAALTAQDVTGFQITVGQGRAIAINA